MIEMRLWLVAIVIWVAGASAAETPPSQLTEYSNVALASCLPVSAANTSIQLPSNTQLFTTLNATGFRHYTCIDGRLNPSQSNATGNVTSPDGWIGTQRYQGTTAIWNLTKPDGREFSFYSDVSNTSPGHTILVSQPDGGLSLGRWFIDEFYSNFNAPNVSYVTRERIIGGATPKDCSGAINGEIDVPYSAEFAVKFYYCPKAAVSSSAVVIYTPMVWLWSAMAINVGIFLVFYFRQFTMSKFTTAQWSSVVLIAGFGTILEWFDFYIYTQLSKELGKVFFPANNATAQSLSYWGVFAMGFISRPIGALLFGHIGDTWGRNKQLMISIICMSIPTLAIGCLPTYNYGSYTAGIAAPILLAICRFFQGLAMGGEFGSAVIYISELASTKRRGTFVALLQSTVNVGMILATLLAMLLQNTLSTNDMLLYGWRIPFLIAFFTALIGFMLRRSMPEPKVFLKAAREERIRCGQKTDDLDAAEVGVTATVETTKSMASMKGSEIADDDDEDIPEEGALSKLHGHTHHKVPFMRMIVNSWAGVLIQITFMAWISSAFYLTVSWLMAGLKKESGIAPIHIQGMLIVSLVFNTIGLLGVGWGFDNGMRAIYANAIITLAGVGGGFITFIGAWTSEAAAWCLVCFFQIIVGAAMAVVVLPLTRIYDPLERTTAFSFGYNCGYGILGGLSPMIVTSIEGSLPDDINKYAPCIWMLSLGVLTAIGCGLLRAYKPRLNKRFVGHLE